MRTMKTSEATDMVLDWLVAKCEGNKSIAYYSTDWSQGGPIIERERIELKYLGYDTPPYWGAVKFQPSSYSRKGTVGDTPLIAAMRCYVAFLLGDWVDVPEELK